MFSVAQQQHPYAKHTEPMQSSQLEKRWWSLIDSSLLSGEETPVAAPSVISSAPVRARPFGCEERLTPSNMFQASSNQCGLQSYEEGFPPADLFEGGYGTASNFQHVAYRALQRLLHCTSKQGRILTSWFSIGAVTSLRRRKPNYMRLWQRGSL